VERGSVGVKFWEKIYEIFSDSVAWVPPPVPSIRVPGFGFGFIPTPKGTLSHQKLMST